MQGFEDDGHAGRGAVGIGENAATPAAAARLDLQQIEMIGVDLGQEQGDVGLAAEGGGIGADPTAGLGEGRLDLAGDIGGEGGKDERRVHRSGVVGRTGISRAQAGMGSARSQRQDSA